MHTPEPAPALPHGSPATPPRLDRRATTFIRAGLVGAVTGLVAIAFGLALHGAEHARAELLARLHRHPAWGWAVLPAIGLAIGSLVGWSVRRFEPDAAGSGIPHLKGVLIHARRMRPWPLLPVKFIGGVLGVGVGLSLGREGPTVQLGAALGKAVGDLLRVRRRTLPQLMSFGAGAGLAAAFNAPLAGFIFVLEELRREMSPLTYGGALVAAVCADIVARAALGQVPSFHIPPHAVEALPLTALPLVALLGVLGGLAGVAFNRALIGSARAARRLTAVPGWLQTGLAGATVGLAGWWIPEALGGGHGVAQNALSGHFTTVSVGFALMLLLAKFALTAVSYASGAPGGIFAPMLLMGALLGVLSGRAATAYLPALGPEESTFAVLGMAAWFTGSVRAPLTGMVLILEMTGNYEHLFALAVCCLVAYLTAEGLRDRPIYETLLEEDLKRGGLGPHRGPHAADSEARHVVMGVQTGSLLDGRAIRDAALPPGCWVVGLERRGREIVPTGATMVHAGDHVTVLVPGDRPELALRIVEMCVAGAAGLAAPRR